MTTLKDNKRTVRNLNKQFLKVKGKLWILAIYLDVNGKKILKLSDAKAEILKKDIDIKRAVFNAVTKGFKLCVVENGASSSVKLLKLVNYGMQYGNIDVTIKRFSRYGHYYTGVWVKGIKGVQHIERTQYVKPETIFDKAKNENLTQDNTIWSSQY